MPRILPFSLFEADNIDNFILPLLSELSSDININIDKRPDVFYFNFDIACFPETKIITLAGELGTSGPSEGLEFEGKFKADISSDDIDIDMYDFKVEKEDDDESYIEDEKSDIVISAKRNSYDSLLTMCEEVKALIYEKHQLLARLLDSQDIDQFVHTNRGSLLGKKFGF